jgi:DMSO/TMAO reductase YedYZ molybdopterin-dependent catalytic subunit
MGGFAMPLKTAQETIARRTLLARGGSALAGLALLDSAFAKAFALQPGEEVIPWLDQPPPLPPGADPNQNLQRWEDLVGSFITPNDKFFSIAHYERPAIDAQSWSLGIGGLVRRPRSFTLAELKARPRREIIFTIECSGDRGFPFFISAVSTARWAGTPLAPILAEAAPLENGIEVVFVGSDMGEETVRDLTFPETFARSMSLDDAMDPKNLLCWEMNGAPLPRANGFPLRLIAPGWYGIANVKWLKRIELRATRLENRFMGRDYVSIREEQRDGQSFWAETSVGRWRINSAPGRVIRQGSQYRIAGAAWGAEIARVEVQIDGGSWVRATLDRSPSEFAWKFWSLGWRPAPGEHTIASRAIDTAGNVQPAMDDPEIVNKHTFWESNGQITRQVLIA